MSFSVHTHGLGLVWSDLPTSTKEGDNQTFFSNFPAVEKKVKEKEWSLNTVSSQTSKNLSQTVTDFRFLKFCLDLFSTWVNFTWALEKKKIGFYIVELSIYADIGILVDWMVLYPCWFFVQEFYQLLEWDVEVPTTIMQFFHFSFQCYQLLLHVTESLLFGMYSFRIMYFCWIDSFIIMLFNFVYLEFSLLWSVFYLTLIQSSAFLKWMFACHIFSTFYFQLTFVIKCEMNFL